MGHAGSSGLCDHEGRVARLDRGARVDPRQDPCGREKVMTMSDLPSLASIPPQATRACRRNDRRRAASTFCAPKGGSWALTSARLRLEGSAHLKSSGNESYEV